MNAKNAIEFEDLLHILHGKSLPWQRDREEGGDVATLLSF